MRVQTTGKKIVKNSKNLEIIEFHDYIWNHHEKFIQISTNMPSIGLEILRILNKFEKRNNFVWMVKPMAACKSITIVRSY